MNLNVHEPRVVAQRAADQRVYRVALGSLRPDMPLAVSNEDGLYRSEEPLIVERGHLVQVDDRDHAAGLQDTGRLIDLGFLGDPVVSGGREHGIKAVFPHVNLLEVANCDRQSG